MLPSKEYNVGYICSHKDWFTINEEYQREEDIWSSMDEKHLIDTILKDLDMPKLYLRKVGEKKYEIVDGQQRIKTIWAFRANKFALSGKISGDELDGLKYEDLPQDLIDQFDTFQLTCVLLLDYDDEKTRELFSKLQRGKPLNVPEKLNAYPGQIVNVMRKIGHHSFFIKVVFSKKRYRTYHIAAKLMLLESKGITDTSPTHLFDFFEENRNLTTHSELSRKINQVLNYLNKTFQEETPEFNSDVWVINLYLLTSDLMNKYVMKDREKELRDFYVNFWKKTESIRRRGEGSKKYMLFVDANRSGTSSKKNITTRFETMKEDFLKKHMDIELFDSKREFDHFEKTLIYRRDEGICKKCRKKVSWREFEADHVFPYARGGKTKISNGQVLCSKCNKEKGANI